MELAIAAVAAAIGYLFGSISFARIVVLWRGVDVDIERIEVPLEGETFVSDSVSATAVRCRGCGWSPGTRG